VYNSETLCVEESMHVKFDDKEPGSETLEQDESYADLQVTEDTPEPNQTEESKDSPEAGPVSLIFRRFRSLSPNNLPRNLGT